MLNFRINKKPAHIRTGASAPQGMVLEFFTKRKPHTPVSTHKDLVYIGVKTNAVSFLIAKYGHLDTPKNYFGNYLKADYC